jgi:hypothetical protein
MALTESIALPATASVLERIERAVSGLAIELPSWGFSDAGSTACRIDRDDSPGDWGFCARPGQ